MSKRGLGSIYQRGAIWWISWFNDGRRFAESTKSARRDVALGKLKKRLAEATRFQPPSRAIMHELFELVVADYLDNGKRSLRDLKIRIESQLEPRFGKLRAEQLTTGAVRQFIARRRADKVANATINRETAIIRRALSLGAQQDPPLVGRVIHIPRLREGNVRSGFVGDEQYRALLRELPDYLKLLLVIAYHTGARKGELLLLQWQQVDRKAKQIRLNAGETKNRLGRLLPIYGDMAAFLDMQRSRHRRLCQAETSVFTDPAGVPIGSFYKAWASACDRAGIPGQLFHDLRRSAVRSMERAGISRSVAMQITGHKTESVYRRYAIVNEADVMDAGRKLGAKMPVAKSQISISARPQ